MKISQRSNIDPFYVMDVVRAAAEKEAQGDEVLHLEIGQPSTKAPDAVIECAQQALAEDNLGYTVALGIPQLRQAISEHYRTRFDLTVDPECIVVTPGSSVGFILAFLMGFEKGARVAVPSPGYPCYRNILQALDLVPVDIPISLAHDYLLLAEDLAALDQPVDGVIVSSPGNPTGSMYSPQQLQQLIEYTQKHEIQFISDEIYHGISFAKPSVSALRFSDDLIVINSFSKYFSMTGWRIGWMVLPKPMVRTAERLIQNLFISTTTLSQLAAVAAFSQYELLDSYVANYQANRDYLYNRLVEIGIDKISSPDGAFYLYADISHLTDDSIAFCQQALKETGVAITPGVDFDLQRGHQTMRLSYAADHEVIKEAAGRLLPWLSERVGA